MVYILVISLLSFFSLRAIEYNSGASSPYARTGISQHATEQEVNKQCRLLQFKYHPDKYNSAEDKKKAQNIFVKVGNDCDYIKDHVRPKREESYYDDSQNHRENTRSHSSGFNFDDFFERLKRERERDERERESARRDKEWREKLKREQEEQRKAQEEASRKAQEEFDEFVRQNTFNRTNFNRKRFTFDEQTGGFTRSHASHPSFHEGVYVNNRDPVRDLTLRREYYGVKDPSACWYASIDALPFYMQSQNHCVHEKQGGALFDFFAGYNFLWAECTIALNRSQQTFDNENTHMDLDVAKTGITGAAFYLGTFLGSVEKLQVNPYFLAVTPGQYASNSQGHSALIAGNPFGSVGVGCDITFNSCFDEKFCLMYISNIRWQKLFSRSVVSLNQESSAVVFDVNPGHRVDFITGINFCAYSRYTFECGYTVIIVSSTHSTLEEQTRSNFIFPDMNVYALGRYKGDSLMCGGGFSLILRSDKKDALPAVPGYAVWVELGASF